MSSLSKSKKTHKDGSIRAQKHTNVFVFPHLWRQFNPLPWTRTHNYMPDPNLDINRNLTLTSTQNPHLNPHMATWGGEDGPKCPHFPETSSLSRSEIQKKHSHCIISLLMLILSTSGRYLCGGVEPSSGGFVRCTSTSSLDDVCRANKLSQLTWWALPSFFCIRWVYTCICTCGHSVSYQCLFTSSLIEPDSNPVPQPKTESCSSEYQRHPLGSLESTVASPAVTLFVCASGEAPRFCDCTAFCNSASKKTARMLSSCLSVYVCTALSCGNDLCIYMCSSPSMHSKCDKCVVWVYGILHKL